MQKSLSLILLLVTFASYPVFAQQHKMLSNAEIMLMMSNSSTTYTVADAPPDSIRSVAMNALFPLRRRYTPNPVVTKDANGGLSVETNPFPGLTSEAAERAEKAFGARDIAGARAEYYNILKASPTCYLAVMNLGDCFAVEGKYDSAIAYYDRSIAMAPLDYLGWINKADILYEMGRYDDARNAIIEVLTLRPRYANARKMLDRMPKLGIARRDSLFAPVGYAFQNGPEIRMLTSMDAGVQQWMWYASAKAVWLGEPKHREELAGSKDLNWNSLHEKECIAALVTGYESLKEKNGSDPVMEAMNSMISDHLADAFVLYEIATRMDEDMMLVVSDEERADVRKYISKYILPKS